MNLLKNKHLIMAMFIAPVLALIAFFATDHMVSEKPHKAVEGSAYKLVARSNCRYQSGMCTLENGDLEMDLLVDHLDGEPGRMVLTSNMPLQQAVISIHIPGTDSADQVPVAMQPDSDALIWQLALPQIDLHTAELRLAVVASGTRFYASTSTVFVDYETTFSRDNFTVH